MEEFELKTLVATIEGLRAHEKSAMPTPEQRYRNDCRLLRLEFIKAAMMGLCAAPNVKASIIPEMAVEVADATLKAAGES